MKLGRHLVALVLFGACGGSSPPAQEPAPAPVANQTASPPSAVAEDGVPVELVEKAEEFLAVYDETVAAMESVDGCEASISAAHTVLDRGGDARIRQMMADPRFEEHEAALKARFETRAEPLFQRFKDEIAGCSEEQRLGLLMRLGVQKRVEKKPVKQAE